MAAFICSTCGRWNLDKQKLNTWPLAAGTGQYKRNNMAAFITKTRGQKSKKNFPEKVQ